MDQDEVQVKNAADRKQVKRSDRFEKRVLEENEADLKFILSTVQGRRFLRRLLARCRMNEISADNSGSWTYFYEGMRKVGIGLLAEITRVDLDAYCKMLIEEKKEMDYARN